MKKSILKIGVVLIIMLIMCTSFIQAATYTKFGISPSRSEASDNYVYTFQPSTGSSLKYIWNVQPYTNETPITTDEVFYCLAQGYGDFGNFSSSANVNQVPITIGGTSPSTYSGPIRLKDANQLQAIRTFYTGNSRVTAFNEDTVHGLVWLLDNMYIAGEDNKTTFLSKINCTDDASLGITGLNGYNIASAMAYTDSTEDDLTDSDIEIAQQLAIWKLTNPTEQQNGFPTIYVSKNGGTLKTYPMTFTELAFDDEDMPETPAGKFREYYVKLIYNYLVNGATEAQNTNYNINSDPNTTISVYANASAQPIVTVIRQRELTGKYNVVIKKVDQNGKTLPNAEFTVNGTDGYITGEDGTVKIATDVQITEANVGNVDPYTIVEKTAPTGYIKYNGTITLGVTKKEATDGRSYVINNATLDNTSNTSGKVTSTIDHNTNTITITVVDTEIRGKYDVILKKVNETGEILPGAVFTVDGTDYTTGEDGTVKIASNVQITKDNLITPDVYTITEKTAPMGYMKYNGTITATIIKQLSIDGLNYEVTNATLDTTSTASGKVTINNITNTITITVVDEPEVVKEYIDLALRKFISKVVDKDGTIVYTKEELADRVPNPKTDNLKGGTPHTAEYEHEKEPVPVSVGDKVTYTLRVYNEGNQDAYITQITDYLSKYLKYVEDTEWVREYGQAGVDTYESKVQSTTLTTITGASENLSNLVNQDIGEGVLLPAYDKTNDKLSYIDVQITCEVLKPELAEGVVEDYKITNIAEITGMTDKNKTPIITIEDELDSVPDNVKPNLPKTEEEWQDYKDDEIGKKKYIPGNEDDDDFEKVIIVIPKYDLSLRKFIVQVGNKNLTDEKGNFTREPIVKTETLQQGIEERGFGTATYIHPKKEVPVKKGQIVTYIIRVYNEGNMDAYVDEITDYLPPYLEFVEGEELNKRYQWEYDGSTRKIKTTITAKTTDDKGVYEKRTNGKLLSAYKGGDTLDYIDVAIRCRVSNKAITDDIQTNIAQITKFSDTKGNEQEDLDSTPNGELIIPPDEELPKYKKELEENPYVPGQEDDDDYDKVVIGGTFDLALRKFITKVNTQEVDTRYPELSIDDNGNIKYTHTKTPVEVCYGDTVIYTIRVYNEGEIDGYAEEIPADVPFGLEFIKDNEINKQFGWRLLDENQEPTEDVSKAKYIVTDYLSEQAGIDAKRDNLIKAFNKEAGLSETNPDYRDVQIAFKVNYQVKEVGEESRILVNVAQISKDSDDDIDSIPKRDEVYDDKNHEDDIDYENVKVKYFDLSLLKWVTRAIVVEICIQNKNH